MSRLAGIHDLSYCFTRLGGAGSSAYAQDWLSLGANLGGMVGKALWYAKGQWPKLVDALAKSGKSVLPTPTAIVDVCMVVISLVDLFNGFGGPDKGAAFASAIDKFDTTWERLDAANPDSRDWSGPGATAYETQNKNLMNVVKSMQDLDKKFADLMTNQANEVTKAHQCIALTCMALVLAQGIALALYMIPIVGAEVSCAWQIIAAFAASATVLAFELFTLSNSMGLVYDVQALGEEYTELAKSATPAPVFAKIEIAAVEETRVSSFKEISDMMKNMSFADAPTLSSLARMAPETDSQEERATLKALTSDETPADDETPDTPPAPGVTPPSMSDISKASGQLAQMSGHVSQHMNLVNQMMGQVQQVASMGQGAAAPAAKAGEAAAEEAAPAEEALVGAAPAPAALAGQLEGAGAALGTEGAERAPIDAAAAAAAASGPAERVL